MISLLRNLRKLFFSFLITQSLTQEGAGDELRHLVPRAAHLWQVSQLPVQHPLELKKKREYGNLFIYLFLSHQGRQTWGLLLKRHGDQTQKFWIHIISIPLSGSLPLLSFLASLRLSCIPFSLLHPVPNWSGRTKISTSFWFEKETKCYGGEPLKPGIFPRRLEKQDPHPQTDSKIKEPLTHIAVKTELLRHHCTYALESSTDSLYKSAPIP